ncbi:MAG TPA: rRNA maturation RNase YbeY [Candidatus Hydrogenedentes bacterium]|nr:rRNA maturation RNase YbeY [Candidatus Hydrogenedentota bacterium]
MNVQLAVRNESRCKGFYRTDALRRLAQRVCKGEGVEHDVELSVLFCDDKCIREINKQYRHKDVPTDVLAFGQEAVPGHEHPAVLGDIVISLETVERHCAESDGGTPDRAALRAEVRLLFCHGLLHLLGAEHGTRPARAAMAAQQAQYLGITKEAAWPSAPDHPRRG